MYVEKGTESRFRHSAYEVHVEHSGGYFPLDSQIQMSDER